MLHGYVFRAVDDRAPRPTLIGNGGYDSTAEESYFFSGAAAVARRYTCIVFDGPGQGAAIIEDGMVFRPDWEAVIAAGGQREPRVACIADPGEFSLFEELKSRIPAFVARELRDGRPLVLTLLNLILRRKMRHPTAGWGLRRSL
jgi:hypothetical protein